MASGSNVSATLPVSSADELVGILRDRLARGGNLPAERTLAEELSVKRHQLRRALEVLRLDGELPAPGARRRAPTRDREALIRTTNPLEVIELRLALEPALARLAALRATPLDIARIQKASVTPPGVERGAADMVFHKLVAEASRNTLAADIYNLLRKVGTDARLHVQNSIPSCPNRLKQRDLEHGAIAAAIAARDPDRAEAAMRSHLLIVQAQIVDRISPAHP